MFATLYNKVSRGGRRLAAFLALVALTTSSLVALEPPPPAAAAIVTNNLVLNLDASNTSSLAASGATGWNSVSPASSTSTSTFFGNAARVSDSTGASMSMDGIGDAAVFPVGVGRSPGSMTVETWIKPGNLRTGWNIFASRWFSDTARTNAPSAQDWHFAIYGTTTSNLKLQLNTGAGILTSNSSFPATSANKWYHVAFTIDAANSNTATLWINGVADGTVANFPHTDSTTAQLHVGDVGGDNTTTMTGNMSRFRIYNAALTPSQMAQNYLTDSARYGYAPTNTVVPGFNGIAKVGTALTTNGGTWGVGDADGTTTTYQWQTSTDASTWTNISGATSASYTPVAGDATNYLRVSVTKTNTAGSTTATSAATFRVQAAAGTALLSGGKLTGLTTTVPNDGTTYNVTLATNNLSATMRLGTTTGLTLINGYASTASYMASTIGASAPIISFRGTGTAINTALANVTYTSATQQTDVVKLYYATAGTTATDTKDYIPIYDNGVLKFHYYAYKIHAAGKNRADMEAALVGLNTTDNVQAPGPWYLSTPRYQVEWDRIKLIVGQNQAFMGARADAGSTNWYWPANTDGYSSATIFGTQSGTTVTATSNIYNQTNTTLPFHPGEPNAGTTVGRSGFFYIYNSALGWDDVPLDTSNVASFTMETFGTAPFNTGSAGTLTQTVSVVANAFDAPANLTVEATGTTALAGTWSPVTPNITGLTLGGYRLEYSTSSSFSPLSVVITQPTATSAIIPGLTANTTYYVRVLAAGSTWGAYSPAVTVTTKTAATTINIVASGGGVAGTDYTLSGGQFYAKSSNTVSINASEIETALNSGASNVVIAADNVIVDAPITWTTARYLTLGNGSTSSVTINKTITASANFSQLAISPSTYTLDVKNGASIRLNSAGTQYLNIGGTGYTLLKTEAQLVAATTAAGNYAIANPITLVNTYTAAPIAINGFTGKLDGLGNTVDSMKLNVSATSSAGLVQVLSGGTIRNLGVTNINGTMTGSSVMANIGGIVGQSTGGTLEQVWSTGFLTALSGASSASVSFGGLVGNASSGTTTIQKSWSSLNISSAGATSFTHMTVGALVGSDVAAYGQQPSASGGNITMNQVYATGDMATGNFSAWRGHGGLIGLHFSTATISITDAFIWSNLVTTDSAGIGGLIGNSGGATPTITNAYTVHPVIAYATTAPTTTNVQVGIVAGAAVSAQNGANWVTDATSGTYLRNVAKPVKNLYAQVVAPANGAYSGMSTQLVDGAAQVQSLATMNLSTSGSPVYTILASAAKGTYNVSYISGLTLGGTAAGAYTISPWPTTTAVTISRLAQTFTWTPTTAVSFGNGTFTPSAAPVSSASSTISYAVTSAGTTGCSVNATTGVVTYTSSGSCEVTATAAQTTDYASASVAKTFVIGEASTAPTVTAAGANTTGVALSWTTPTVNATASLTGYQILYSTSASMTSAATINTGNTDTRRLITGLTAGTTYYFQVRAVSGTTWYGSVNAVAVSAAPKATATTITVVSTGSGTLGTDYFIAGGNLYTTSTTANVNVADIQNALLTGGLTIAAENVVVNTSIAWATSQVLTLGNTAGGSLAINDTITASGVSGGLVITPTTYALKVNTGAEIILSGASSTLSIGGNVYTLIRSTGDLASVTAGGNFALAKPIAYATSASALTAAPINVSFAGNLDGLGNTIDRLNISTSTAGNYGLVSTLASGGTIRNLGVTNLSIAIGSGNYRVGGLAGGSTGGTIDQVWSTGLIKTTTTNTGWLGLGGLVGNASAGTLTISKSWSSVNINSSTTGTTTALEQGGIIGGNESTIGSPNSQTGAVVKLDQVYATGTLNWASNGHRGIGGLFGLHYNTTASAQTITDSFSWVTFAAGVPANNSGGIFGVAAGSTSTVTRTYQATSPQCVASGSVGFSATPSCDAQQTAGSTVASISGAAWTTANGTTLANVATPTRQLFVKVTAPGNLAYNGIGYTIVDGSGTAVTLSSLNLSVSGTPVYSIASDVLISATPYKVDYVSGLTLGGSAAALYSLTYWPEPTSVTISKYPQTVTWTPTTSISFGSGSVTPAAATASGGTAITYAVTSAGTTGCTVNASTGVITYTRGGNCAITATAANTGNYLGATASATFTIEEPATGPTASVVRTGTGALSVGWTAPTVNSSVALTGYQVFYSTSPTMAPAASVTVGNTRGWLTTGLTNGTTYYFQVRALSGSTWTGPLSTVASGAAAATATTINVVTSGGGVAGTNYTVNGGVISTTGTASINAADINNILATEGTVQLAADTVNVNGALSWSSNAVLVLGNTSSSTVNVNSTISGSGDTAGVKILPSSYGLLVKSGAYIRLTGATPTFNLGGTAYTVVNTVAGLANVAAGTTWALTAPITLTASYTTAVRDIVYAGTMDGLGNTISNMQITVSTARDAGFFASLGGATVRNVGFTNVNISSATGGINTRLGSIAGNGSSAGTNNISQAWATGFIKQTASTTGTKTEVGGLFGGATTGTLNISKSWSSVAISTNAPSVGSGGIIGTNVGSFGGGDNGSNNLSITESYSTGNVLRDLGTSTWYGNAGIIGVAYGASTTITNVFAWGNINSTGIQQGTSTAGISGVGTATITNAYTTYSSCGGTPTNCLVNQTAGAVVSGGTGFTTGLWQSVNGTSLVNLTPPTKNLYVKVVAPTDGSYGTLSYQIVDSTGTVQTLSSLNLTVTGTPVYTITASSARATYPSVSYVSGLTLGGSSAAVYSLSAWITNTSVTITRLAQSVTWAPTTAIPFRNGTFTPSATPTVLGTPTITYAVSSQGTTGCTVNVSTGVVTYVSAGTCAVTATAAVTTDFTAGSAVVNFVVGAAPTLTVVASGGGVSGTDYTVSGGVLSALADASITASDLTTLLASGSIQLAGNVVVNAPITWAANTTLTLGGTTSSTVTINEKITASGNTAGIVIRPATYSLSTKSGAALALSGTTPTLSIGGTSYTLIKSIADLGTVATTGNYALAVPLTYSSTIAAPPIGGAFAGTFDGLGNTIDKLTIVSTANLGTGLFKNLNGGTIRNLGLTNEYISLEPTVTTNNLYAGGLVGDAAGGTLDQVWTTGFMRVKPGSTYSGLALGGLTGANYSGTLNITKSWSALSINGWGSTYTNFAVGGIVGGDFSSFTATGTTAGGTVNMSQVYSLGDLANPMTTGATSGIGGIMGVHAGTGTVSIVDAFSWSQLGYNSGANAGGIISIANGGAVTITNYSSIQAVTNMTTGTSTVTKTNGIISAAFGSTLVALESLPNWYASGKGTSLVNLPVPYKNFFVRVVAPTDGTYGTIGYQLTNGVGSTVSAANFNLTISGTPTFSIASNAAISATPYNVDYVSGLTFTYSGTLPNTFRFGAYAVPTAVTISKYSQTISLTSTAPTTAVVGSTYTLAGTASSGLSITYSIDAGSTAICSIAGAVVTFNALGTCVINANQAGNASYLAAPQQQQSAIATVKGSQTASITSTAPTTAKVAGSTYTPTASATSGLVATISIDSASSAICSITAGVVSFLAVGDCVINANQAGNANWNAATQGQQTVSVAKGVSTVSITSVAPTNAVVGGSTYTLSATKTAANTNSVVFSVDSTTSTICSVSGAVVSFLLVGTCKVNANLASDTQYEAATVQQQSITVAKGSQTVTFTSSAPNAARVGAPNYTVTATGGASTSAIVLSVDPSSGLRCSVSGFVVSYLTVGDCVLNLNQAADTNYNAATQVQQTVTITTDGRCPNGVVSGNYCLMRFNTSGTWTVPAGVTSVDILAVGGGGAGGGGGGGNMSGGGGGGGEVLENLGTTVVPGTKFTVTVGSGGIGGGAAQAASASTPGSNSSVSADLFTTLTARGGGQGGTYDTFNTVARPAGTGNQIAGGGGAYAQTATRGNIAGVGGVSSGGLGRTDDSVSTNQAAGGGGGAGGNGGAASTATAGIGGIGKSSTILGQTLGGGGGGGKRNSGGSGGTATSGGGAGGLGVAGAAGTANTGGGGGGSGGSNNGGNGGSGVVVFRVALESQTVSFSSVAPTGLIFGTSTTYTPTATGTNSEVSPVITVDASSSSVCSMSAGVVSITGAGTCTLNANQEANGFYAAATQAQQSFTVAKKNQTVTITGDPASTKVNTTYTPAGTSTSGGAVTFSVTAGSASVCTILNGVVSFNAVGDCVIKGDSAASTNWNAATQGSKTVTVTKGDQTITFTNNPAVPKVNTTYTPTATATSGGAVSFTIAAASALVCSVSNGVVSFNAVGSCQILANSDSSTNWNAATQEPKTITVLKGDQTIEFTNNPAVPKVNTTYIPTATATSGGTITYTIAAASASICTISNGVVSFNAVGSCQILANSGSVTNWNAATQEPKTITVLKGDQTVSFTSPIPTAVVDGATYTPTATSTSGSAVTLTIASTSASVCSITDGVVSFIGAGDCVVNGSQAGNTNWNAAPLRTQTIVVGKGAQAITFTSTIPVNPAVGGSDYTVVATGGASGNAVTFSVDSASVGICSVSGSTVSFLSVGSCVVKANQLGSANYNAASVETQTIAVGQGTQVVAFSSTAPTDAVVDGATYTVTATGGASGNPVFFAVDSASSAVCTLSGATVSFVGVGDCVIKVNQNGSTNYFAATEKTQTITVGKGAQIISFSSTAPTDAVVDGSSYTVTATGGATGIAVGFSIDATSTSVCAISGAEVSFIGAGTCLVNANQDGNDNYNAAPVRSQSITVGKGSQSVVFTSSIPTGVRVGDSGYQPTATGGASTASVAIQVSDASTAICALNNGTVSFYAAGDCVLEVTQAGDANYNAAAKQTQTISVAKGLQSITQTNALPTNPVVDGATYTPTFTGGPSNSALNVSIAAGSSTICEIANGEISFIGAGLCEYTVNQIGNDNYEAATEFTESFTVGKGSQLINISSTAPSDAVVGGATFTPVATGGATGHPVVFRIDDSSVSVCSISAGVVRFVGVGTCLIGATQSGDSNYETASDSISFSVGKGSQLITFTSAAPTTAVVVGAQYSPTATGGATANNVVFAIAAASAAVCELTAGKISFQTPGDCVIEANQAGNTNYNAAPMQTQTVSVGKGRQVLTFESTAPSAARVGGTTYQPIVTAGPSTSSVAFSIAGASTSVCTVSNGVVSFTGVGDCVIQANQDGDANYNAANQLTQTISVAKGVQVVTFTSTPPSLRPVQGTTYTPTASSGGSGIGVVFTIAAEASSLCSISNGVISFQAVGDCVVYANQAGNDNWNAAPQVSQVFDITKGEQIVTITSSAPTDAVVGGTAYEPTATGGNGTKAVTYSVSALTADICSATDGSISFQAAGECLVVANQAGDANYNAATPVIQSINVGKGSQTVSFSSVFIAARVEGTAYRPTANEGPSVSPARFTIASLSSAICEIVSGTVYFHAVGDCVIELNQDGDANYNPAAAETQVISVAKGNQLPLVAQSSLTGLSLGETPPTTVIGVTGGSGTGAVTWTISPASAAVCSLSGDVLTGLSVGYCDLTATKAGDDNFLEETAEIAILVATGGQTPVRTSVSVANPVYEPGLELTLSLDGGNGSGAIWFESTTPEVCTVTESGTVSVLKGGSCSVVGHKQGDESFIAAQDALTFTIARAEQGVLDIVLDRTLTYSPEGAVTGNLSVTGANSSASATFSITSGTCELSGAELSATQAGPCVVSATVGEDDSYLAKTVEKTFTIGKAVPAALTSTVVAGEPSAIAWQGKSVTHFTVAGGSGTGSINATTTTANICTVSLTGSVIEVTGLTQGTCVVSMNQATDSNYQLRQSTFNVSVLDLPSVPQNFTVNNTGANQDGSMAISVSWAAPATADTRAAVSGYEVQSKTGNGTWATVPNGDLDADATSLTVTVPPWSQVFFRVAPKSALDASNGSNRNWITLTQGGTNVEVPFDVTGTLAAISTNVAATTSGETVTLTGTGFDSSITTRVQLSTASAVFAAGFGRAALAQTVVVPATVLSPTQMTFKLPKITLPAGRTSLATQVRILTSNGISSQPVSLDYIPKKLAQTLGLVGLPATKATIVIGGAAVRGTTTVAVVGNPTRAGATPVVTATPASVCTASVVNNAVTLVPVGRGVCAISVVAPATPGLTASAAKAYSYTVKGATQALTFANPGPKTFSTSPLALTALSSALLPVAFSTTTPKTCAIVENALQMLAAGPCSIVATQTGNSTVEAAAKITQTFAIAKATRSSGLTATADSVSATGERTSQTFDVTSSLAAAPVTVFVGENPLDIPVALNKREGTLLFTVDAAADKAGICSAEPGEAGTLMGSITMLDIGTCKVTIAPAEDAAWNVVLKETIVITVVGSALPDGAVDQAAANIGEAALAPEDTDTTPGDVDTEPAVALNLDPTVSKSYSFGGEDGFAYDPASGKINVKTRSVLVGTWTAILKSPSADKKWFKIKGKIVKKKQTYVNVSSCTTKLTVKKDPKLKKKVSRVIGAGCVLSDEGKAAFTAVGIQKIKMKYKRIRQYANTGLDYRGSSKAKTRILKKVNRTVVIKVGRTN